MSAMRHADILDLCNQVIDKVEPADVGAHNHLEVRKIVDSLGGLLRTAETRRITLTLIEQPLYKRALDLLKQRAFNDQQIAGMAALIGAEADIDKSIVLDAIVNARSPF